MTATAEAKAEHPQERPIDKLQKILGNQGEKIFIAPDLKICLYSWQNFRGQTSDKVDAFTRERNAKNIHVILADPDTQIATPPEKTENVEFIEINERMVWIDTQDDKPPTVSYNSRIGIISTTTGAGGIKITPSTGTDGTHEEYDSVINLLLETILRIQEVTDASSPTPPH